MVCQNCKNKINTNENESQQDFAKGVLKSIAVTVFGLLTDTVLPLLREGKNLLTTDSNKNNCEVCGKELT